MLDLHIDTDMGVDDALALVAASRLSGVRIVAVSTVFGNVPLSVATRNAVLLRKLLGGRFDIFAGAASASDGWTRNATHVHGEDGLGRATRLLDVGSSRSRLTRLIVQSHLSYVDFYSKSEAIDGCFPHDTIALLAACRADWFQGVAGRVNVDLTSEHRGRTRLEMDERSTINVAMGGRLRNVRNFLQTLF
jgi:inosine-uridine nucleoside N-ribohydrolase